MILDKELICSNDQVITVTADATNAIDTEACGIPWMASTALVRNIHKGVPIPFLVLVTGGFTAAGAATLVTAIQTDSAATMDSSPVSIFTTAALALATLVAGYRIFDGFLNLGVDMKQFIGVEYTVATGPMVPDADNPCTVFAGVVAASQTNV